MRQVLGIMLLVGLAVAAAPAVFGAETVKESQSRTVRQTGMPAVTSSMTTTITVVVTAVDQAKRTVKLKLPDGTTHTYKVGANVRNLSQVKPGDTLTATETEVLRVYAMMGPAKPSASETATFERAPKGAKPGFTATDSVTVTGTVKSVDVKARKVAVTGPRGRTQTFTVAADVKNLSVLRPGDTVVAKYTRTLTMAVQAPEK
jgi:hypothetical protein